MRRKKQLNKSVVYSVALALTVAMIFLAAGAPSMVQAAKASRSLPIYSVQRDDQCVSLTFDAAWGNEDTQTLIDILGTYGVKATFFRCRRLGEEVSGECEGTGRCRARSDDTFG